MIDGLADRGTTKKPHPPKSTIFDGSFVPSTVH